MKTFVRTFTCEICKRNIIRAEYEKSYDTICPICILENN
jgi:hypothetical protein